MNLFVFNCSVPPPLSQGKRPLKSRTSLIKKKQRIISQLGPTLLLQNDAFEDIEFFKPFEHTVELRHLPIRGRILASVYSWLLFDTRDRIILYNPYTDARRVLPYPRPNFRIHAGTLSADLTVFIFGKDNLYRDMFILLSQNQEWIGGTFSYINPPVYSLLVHENCLWFFDNSGNLFVASIDLDDPQVHMFHMFDRPLSISLLAHGHRLLFVDNTFGFPHPPICLEIRHDDNFNEMWAQQYDVNGENIFVVPTKVGFSIPPPIGHNGNMIFIGVNGDADCSAFNRVTNVHHQIKDCREGVNHNSCSGIWFHS